MAQKGSQARLTLPKDIWDVVKFDDYENPRFGFFITDDSRVVISEMESGINSNYEFIGICTFDDKHRFFIPKNVDTYLGAGKTYYFSASIPCSNVYFYKLDLSISQKRQNLQISKLLSDL